METGVALSLEDNFQRAGAQCGDIDAWRSNICASHIVSGNRGVSITQQMCNRVTNP